MSDRKKKKEFNDKIVKEIHTAIENQGLYKLSEILKEIKSKYQKEIVNYGIKDSEQSWRAFKGKLLEDIIIKEIKKSVESIGLGIIKGDQLDKNANLTECLSWVKRSLVVDYREFGMHLPDADIVIYDPDTCIAIAIISSKSTLRERIAQTGYWSLKLKSSKVTENVKVFFVTLDEDGDLTVRTPPKKGRAISEVDTDGAFVITDEDIEESQKVMKFDKFMQVIQKLKRSHQL